MLLACVLEDNEDNGLLIAASDLDSSNYRVSSETALRIPFLHNILPLRLELILLLKCLFS